MLDAAPSLVWFLAVVQAAGLVSATLVRRSHGSVHQSWCQRLFLGYFALLGLITMLTLSICPSSILPLGITLSLMLLAVTWDCGATGRDSVV